MKLFWYTLLMFALFIVTIGLINCAIEHLEVKNKDNVTVFIVSEDHWIKIPNRHRTLSSSIRLTLSGVKIECVETKSSVQWIFHLNDKTSIDLVIEEKENQTTEYYFHWHDSKPNESRELCLHYGDENWYSTFQSLAPRWPMENKRKVSKHSFNYLLDHNMGLANYTEEYYRILEHLFVNSDGFAVLLDEYQPWFMSRDVDHDGDSFMCFSTQNASPYSSDSNCDIKMHLFASKNVRTVTDYTVHESGLIPKPIALPDVNRIVYPSIYALRNNQDDILKFSNQLNEKGFKHFELLDNDMTWEKSQGDLAFEPVRYPNVDNMIRELATHGQRFRLEIFPIANNTHESTHKYFLRDNITGKLTNYLDFTQMDACDWFESALKKLRYEDNLTLFHPYARNIVNVNMFNSTDPNLYIKNYIATVGNFVQVISLSAFKEQYLPVYVQLMTHEMSDIPNLLKQFIPNALSISIADYSFFSLNTIRFGGEFSEKVYIRWLQAASLMPCMVFWDIPTRFSANALELTKTFINVHYDHAPLMIELGKKLIKCGSPIVRPMWYAEPDNPKTYKIDDQFMLGDDIVVAPVVVVGMRERNVYLPADNWIDQHGKTYVGSNEFKVNAPLEELPYFKREII